MAPERRRNYDMANNISLLHHAKIHSSHYSDVTWGWWRLKLPATPLFVHASTCSTNKKENTTAPHYRPFLRRLNGEHWFSVTKHRWFWQSFQSMASSCTSISRGTTGERNYSCVLFQNGVDSACAVSGGGVQRVLGNVPTRISVRYTGMHNQYIGILLLGENTYSMRRKLPDYNCSAGHNCMFVWTQLTNVNKCCGRDCGIQKNWVPNHIENLNIYPNNIVISSQPFWELL